MLSMGDLEVMCFLCSGMQSPSKPFLSSAEHAVWIDLKRSDLPTLKHLTTTGRRRMTACEWCHNVNLEDPGTIYNGAKFMGFDMFQLWLQESSSEIVPYLHPVCPFAQQFLIIIQDDMSLWSPEVIKLSHISIRSLWTTVVDCGQFQSKKLWFSLSISDMICDMHICLFRLVVQHLPWKGPEPAPFPFRRWAPHSAWGSTCLWHDHDGCFWKTFVSCLCKG